MKKGSPYMDHAVEFRQFLKDHGFVKVVNTREIPAWLPFYRECFASMDRDCPSESSFKASYNGSRRLPDNVLLFCVERYKYTFDWRNLPLSENRRGQRAKTNQLFLQGIREQTEIAQRLGNHK
jgi:hypothetical protein